MNKVILMGRLTRDPEVRYSAGENSLAIARYTLAVDRRFKRDGEATADFISCVAFGRTAEFAEKYFRQGLKIAISGRIQTGSYVNREGQKVYTTEVVVEDQEFAESKAASESHQSGFGRRLRRAGRKRSRSTGCRDRQRVRGRIYEYPGWNRRGTAIQLKCAQGVQFGKGGNNHGLQ